MEEGSEVVIVYLYAALAGLIRTRSVLSVLSPTTMASAAGIATTYSLKSEEVCPTGSVPRPFPADGKRV